MIFIQSYLLLGLEPDPEASFILSISKICHPPEALPFSPEDEGVCFHCPSHYSESIGCGFKHLQEHSLWPLHLLPRTAHLFHLPGLYPGPSND